MKAPCSVLLAALLAGCASSKTVIERPVFGTNGAVGYERTTTAARTFADGKNRLADFKAGQTAQTQKIGIGEQTGESTSDVVGQLANGLMMLGRLAALTQGVPLPAPAPVAVTRTNAPAK